MKPGKKFAATEIYALAFGLFLGLALWKFGDPVILDDKIIPPSSLSEFWADAWPTHWANWIFLPFALVGALVAFKRIFPAGRAPSRAGSWGHSPRRKNQLALVAAVAVAGLATHFRKPNRGCRFDGDNALAIFWLRRVLFSWRACNWSAEHRLGAFEFKL